MIEIHYGVVRIDGQWMIISEGLRTGPFATDAEAREVARRMAAEAAGLDVSLHVQDKRGVLRHEPAGGEG
ncbi:MAG TPA: DUF2188 domain-containing protein [Caulobacteraceae bacterium]|jgi:hypothetical protein